MEIVTFIIRLLVHVVVAGLSLWVAMKLTKEEGPLLLLLTAALIAALVAMLPVPYIGPFLSFIVLLILISRWTTAEIWPDAVLIVVVAWALASLANFALSMALR